MKYRFKNLLVTGGAGFIGSNFIEYILNKHPDLKVYNIDNLTYAGSLNNTKEFENCSRYTFYKGDICDKKLVKKIFNEHKIDGVINFAAESHVDNSIINPEIFIRSNILGVYNLLNIAYNTWMTSPFKKKTIYNYSRFHQVSTDEVYGSIPHNSFSEENKYNPSSPYSASKASADMIVKSFNTTYGLDTTISISSNNFGPNQHAEKLIPKSIFSIINKNPVIIYGDGLNVRDWIYVKENCKAIDLIFDKANSGQTFNVASKIELSNLELLEKINKILSKFSDLKFDIKFVKDRPGHDGRYSLNINKIKKQLGWKCSNKFEEHLENYVREKIKNYT